MSKMKRVFRGFLNNIPRSRYHLGHDKYLDKFLTRLENQIATYPRSLALEDMFDRLLTKEQAEFLTRVPRGTVFVSDMVEKFDGIISEEEVNDMLDSLFKLGMLEQDNDYYFHFPEVYIGWFEFVWMKDRHGELPMEEISRLFVEFKKDFSSANFQKSVNTNIPKLLRTLVREEVLSPLQEMKVLDYESAVGIVEMADVFGVCDCSCQHLTVDCLEDPEEKEKMMKNFPIRRCLVFDHEERTSISSFIKHGLVEEIRKEEALEILEMSQEKGYVQNADNSQMPNFICNCPKGICGVNKGIESLYLTNLSKSEEEEKLPVFASIAPSRFVAKVIHPEDCVGCGLCVEKCFGFCYSMDDEEGVVVTMDNPDFCIGCGVCSSVCPQGVLAMEDRPEDHFTMPAVENIRENKLARGIVSVTEMGMLHALLFPDDEKLSHRIMIPIFRGLERSHFGRKMFRNEKMRKWIEEKVRKKIARRMEQENK